MWALRGAQHAARAVGQPTMMRMCRRCMLHSRPPLQPLRHTRPSPTRWKRAFASAEREAEEYYVSEVEEEHGMLLETAYQKVEQYHEAISNTREDLTVEEAKARAKVLKETGPLYQAWQTYHNLRESIIETRPQLNDPDPTMREMFAAEYDALIAELDDLILNVLPRLLLPPLPAATLPAVMNLTAGIGGGESARFLEEMSKMYMKYAENKGWKVKVVSSAEGAMAKGSGGNGFREMSLQFSPGEGASEDAECFGELMWEQGTHRVQRVPPGSTVDKMHSSTVNINVSPIYPDTDEAPLLDPKDVKEDTMRARGPGGQHVNKTESAIRLTHLPTGITVSMQDSRSQAQNRTWAWDVLRMRLSERKRQEEQERRNATRIDAIKNSSRGDKVRTYNFPQDRVTDHRIGFSSNGLENILSGEGFDVIVEAMKKDYAERRMGALLRGEEDLLD